jgi:hypothetical protein
MNSLKIIIMVALFVILTPGVFVRAPGSKYVSALVHGALFAFVWYLISILYPILEGNAAQSKALRISGLQKKLANPKLPENQKKYMQDQLDALMKTK